MALAKTAQQGDFPISHVGYRMTKNERLAAFKQYYLWVLCEDPQEGSKFDSDVLHAIDRLEEQYPDD